MAEATREAALAEMAEAMIIASFSQRLTQERVHLTHVPSLPVSLASGGAVIVSMPRAAGAAATIDGNAALPTLQFRRSSCDGGQRDRRRPQPGLCRSLGAGAASLLHGVNDIMVNV